MSLPLLLRQAVLGLIITSITKSKDKARCWGTETVAPCLFFSLPFSPYLTSLPFLPSFRSPFYPSHPFPLSSFLSSFLHLSAGLCLTLFEYWLLSQYSNLINQGYVSLWVSSLRGHFKERSWSMVDLVIFDNFFSSNKLIRTLRGYPLSNSCLPPLRLGRLSTVFSTTILTSSSYPCFMKQFLCFSPNVDEL